MSARSISGSIASSIQEADYGNFAFQLFHASRPGTLDTSFVSTDNINNPRTMNAVYLLGPRLLDAKRWGKETLAGGGANNNQFNDYVARRSAGAVLRDARHGLDAARAQRRRRTRSARSARSIASISTSACSARNGCCTSTPLVGGKPITPIEIAVARKNSAYFKATEAQTLDMALFFLKTTAAHHLRDAPGGAAYLDRRTTTVLDARQGGVRRDAARAAIRASCRPPRAGPRPGGCAGKDYLMLEQLLGLDEDAASSSRRCATIVTAPRFPAGQLPVGGVRVPVTLLQTNACSPLATNAHRRQHLGQLLVAVLQGSAVGRSDHLVPPVHRRAANVPRCPPADADTRVRRRSSASGRRRPSC